MGEADVRSVRTAGGRADNEEPDAVFARGSGVAYRYTIRLRDPEESGTILRILADVAIPLRYMLLLSCAPGSGYRAYVGLSSSDVLDLPVRFASSGILIERGEELGGRQG